MKFICVTEHGGNRVKLDISDLEMEHKEQLEPFLVFNCSTFKNIKDYDTDPVAFDYIFKIPNWALQRLNDEQKKAVVTFFASTCYTIREKMPRDRPMDFINAVEELGKHYYEMCKTIGIYDLFKEYSYNHIQMQDISGCGTRPQDSDELTFDEPKMRETMVLAMFCKFATPIFGELINNLPQTGEDSKNKLPRQKESRCSGFLREIHKQYFPELYNRLEYYIKHIVVGMCGKNKDIAAATFAGHTINTRTSNIMSSLWVRNYVLVNLEKPDSNIMKYTDSMVRTLVQTQDTASHKTTQVRPRKAPGSMLNGDDGNVAHIEVDSMTSVGTADGPLFIKTAIPRVISNYRFMYEISKEEFDKCVEHFRNHPIYPSLLNKFMMTVIFGPELGGGRGIETINADSFRSLAAMLQLIAFSLGLFNLGIALTASKSLNIRVLSGNSPEDLFKRQAPTCPYYRDCRARFSTGLSDELYQDYKRNMREMEFDKQMDELLNDLATTRYTINVPDILLDQVPGNWDQPLRSIYHNGDEIVPTVDITEEMCKLIGIYSTDNATAENA